MPVAVHGPIELCDAAGLISIAELVLTRVLERVLRCLSMPTSAIILGGRQFSFFLMLGQG